MRPSPLLGLLIISTMSVGLSFATEAERRAIARSPVFSPLGEKAIGVLALDIQRSLEDEARSAPPNVVGFAHDLDSYRLVYLPCSPDDDGAETLIVRVGSEGRERKRFDSVRLATAESLAQFGVSRPYELVELEINGGLGSPRTESFVATHLTIIGQTSEYPLDPSAVVKRLQHNYELHVRGLQKNIDHRLQQVAARVLERPTGPRESRQATYVTWLSKKAQLQIEFRTEISNGRYSYANGTAKTSEAGNIGAGSTQDENGKSLRYGTKVGIRLGMRYTVARDGKLASIVPIEMEEFIETLPPPQIAVTRPK